MWLWFIWYDRRGNSHKINTISYWCLFRGIIYLRYYSMKHIVEVISIKWRECYSTFQGSNVIFHGKLRYCLENSWWYMNIKWSNISLLWHHIWYLWVNCLFLSCKLIIMNMMLKTWLRIYRQDNIRFRIARYISCVVVL